MRPITDYGLIWSELQNIGLNATYYRIRINMNRIKDTGKYETYYRICINMNELQNTV